MPSVQKEIVEKVPYIIDNTTIQPQAKNDEEYIGEKEFQHPVWYAAFYFRTVCSIFFLVITRPDTRLSQSRAGEQGPNLRSPEHLGRSSTVKE